MRNHRAFHAMVGTVLVVGCCSLCSCQVALPKNTTLFVADPQTNSALADVPVSVQETGMNVLGHNQAQTRTNAHGFAEFTFPNYDTTVIIVGQAPRDDYYILHKQLREQGGLIPVGMGSESERHFLVTVVAQSNTEAPTTKD